MFKLTIGEMNCAVSDFEHDTFCFYTFDARKDIFNLNDGDNGLVRFVQSVNPSDTTIQDSINIVQTICAEGRHTTDIETSLGMYGVSFPAISTDGALLCYCENLICIVLSVIRYLSINKYKFMLCAHCGKPFCVPICHETSNTKYCKRLSPCVLSDKLSYTHLPCEQAVRNIQQQLGRMRKRIYDSLYNSLEMPLTSGRNITEFLCKCDRFQGVSVQVFNDYYAFLNEKLIERGPLV